MAAGCSSNKQNALKKLTEQKEQSARQGGKASCCVAAQTAGPWLAHPTLQQQAATASQTEGGTFPVRVKTPFWTFAGTRARCARACACCCRCFMYAWHQRQSVAVPEHRTARAHWWACGAHRRRPVCRGRGRAATYCCSSRAEGARQGTQRPCVSCRRRRRSRHRPGSAARAGPAAPSAGRPPCPGRPPQHQGSGFRACQHSAGPTASMSAVPGIACVARCSTRSAYP